MELLIFSYQSKPKEKKKSTTKPSLLSLNFLFSILSFLYIKTLFINSSLITSLSKTIETNVSNKAKNQLKSTDQIKTNPIKNLDNQTLAPKIQIKSFNSVCEFLN